MEKTLVSLLLLLLLAISAAAQPSTDTPTCVQNLIPCSAFLNSTSPPESCCKPLTDAVKNQLPCLCSLFKNKQIIQAFKVNLTQALELPKHCGVTSGTSICDDVKANSPTSSPGASSTPSQAPPTTNNVSGACGIQCMGASVTVSLFLFLWSAMLVMV